MFKLRHEHIIDFYRKMNFEFDLTPYQANFLCLQGAEKKDTNEIDVVPNKPDKYNDIIIAFTSEAMFVFEGTVDPGEYYTKYPMSHEGCAHLPYGQQYFVKGKHMQKYPALRAKDERLWAFRDHNKNHIPDEGDNFTPVKYSGINIHAGGKSENIGKWSAGCINISGGWDGEQWNLFMNFVDNSPRNKYGVAIWSAKDFEKFIGNPDDFNPTLFYTCICYHVGILQKHLKLKQDNIFGWKTHQAVIKFQKKFRLGADGIVGDKTWEIISTERKARIPFIKNIINEVDSGLHSQ